MSIPYVTFMKHAQKVTKTASSSRPVLKGVYHAPNGDLVVSDSFRLYVAKKVHSNTEGIVQDPKTGETIEENYPDVSRLLPNASEAKYTVKLDVNQAFDAFKALLAMNKLDNNGKYPMTSAEILGDNALTFSSEGPVFIAEYKPSMPVDGKGNKMTFNTQFFSEALALFKDVGVTEITMRYYGSMRPFTLSAGEDDDLLALILPIRTY